jgi:hypothetical protein
MEFKTIDNKNVIVDFRVEGASGAVIQLEPGARPVVFREYNTDEDIFKSIRAFLCEIQIQTNVNGVTLDTFIANNDTDIEVVVHYNGYYGLSTWLGYILQDDIEELWDDGNHYLIVRAAEGYGLLKSIPFSVGGAEAIGKYTPLQFIENALSTIRTGITADYWLLCNLFHDSMVDTAGRHPLNQCYLDAKTFQQEGTEYDDCYTVIEKICRAFGVSMFMDNQFWFFRPEELYTSYNNNLRFANVTSVNQFEVLTRYDIEIGVGREMQPIMPEMLRSLNRKTKFDEIDFYYKGFDEVLQNETFARGTLTATGADYKEFTVDSWTYGRGLLDSTTIPTGTFRAREDYNTSLTGGLKERYIYFTQTTTVTPYWWIKALPVNVNNGGSVKFVTDIRYFSNPADAVSELPIAFIILEVNASTFYSLQANGDWFLTTSLANATGYGLKFDRSASTGIVTTEWNTIQVDSKQVPAGGILRVYLSSGSVSGNNTVYFKNFELRYLSAFESANDLREIKGVNSYYNKTDTVNNSFKQEIFLDDHFSPVFKGAIFQSDQTTLTDADWYRYRFAGESFGFRRQNDTAHWEHNRFNRNKIDVNMYGISWDTGSGYELMSFKNTYRFMDDDINKIYYPSNIAEIDLVNNTWSGTLVEVWDETKDLPISQSFQANLTAGTYSTSPLTAPLTLVTSGGFSIQSGNTARYDAATTLNTPVTCFVNGRVSASTYPKNVTFELRKNGTAINTITQTIYTANQFFTVYLDVPTQTIATTNTFTIVITGHSSVIISAGNIIINSTAAAYTYDTYTENYLYQ